MTRGTVCASVRRLFRTLHATSAGCVWAQKSADLPASTRLRFKKCVPSDSPDPHTQEHQRRFTCPQTPPALPPRRTPGLPEPQPVGLLPREPQAQRVASEPAPHAGAWGHGLRQPKAKQGAGAQPPAVLASSALENATSLAESSAEGFRHTSQASRPPRSRR